MGGPVLLGWPTLLRVGLLLRAVVSEECRSWRTRTYANHGRFQHLLLRSLSGILHYLHQDTDGGTVYFSWLVLLLLTWNPDDNYWREPGYEMLVVSNGHVENHGPIDTANWYGLYSNGTNSSLKSVSIVANPCPSAWGGEDSAYLCIDVVDSVKPMILVGKPGGFVEGKIPTYSGNAGLLHPGREIDLADLVLITRGATRDRDELPDTATHAFHYTIMLHEKANRKKAQKLMSHGVVSEEDTPILLWAGDLDGDGKVDVLLDRDNKYSVTEYALYLSSAAEKGMFVKWVALLKIVAC